MPENTDTQNKQKVDGFADTQGNQQDTPDTPDYGAQGRKQPMSEEERMQAEREINEKGDSNRVQERKHQK